METTATPRLPSGGVMMQHKRHSRAITSTAHHVRITSQLSGEAPQRGRVETAIVSSTSAATLASTLAGRYVCHLFFILFREEGLYLLSTST